MKIINLKAENIKRVKAIDITPDPTNPLVVVGGRNGQGKTTTLDSIWMALGGKRAIPDMAVRHGADEGKVEVTLDGDFIARLTIQADTNKGQVELLNKAGGKYASPQKIMDGFMAKFSFDPLAFKNYEAKKQVEIVKELAGVDTTQIDNAYKELYNERTYAKKELDRLTKELAALPPHPGFRPDKVDTSALAQQINEGLKINTYISNVKQKIGAVSFEINKASQDIEQKLKEIEQLKVDIATRLQAKQELEAHLAQYVEVPLVELQQQLEASHLRNADIDKIIQHEEKAAEVEDAKKKVSSINDEMEKLQEQRREMIKGAKLPVQGLEFTDEGIFFNGVPWENCSSAEQLRISVAMGIALNPALKVLLIRDGSLLDDDSLNMVASMAAEHDAQVWIERVGEGEECSVIIEDGEVKEDRTHG